MPSIKENAFEIASLYSNARNRNLDESDFAAVQAGATETLLTTVVRQMSKVRSKEEIIDFAEISEEDYDRLYYFFDFFEQDKEKEIIRQHKIPILEKADVQVRDYSRKYRNKVVAGLLEATIYMLADQVYDYISDEDCNRLRFFFEFDPLKDDDVSIRGQAVHSAVIYSKIWIKNDAEAQAWNDGLCYAYEAVIVKEKLKVVIKMIAKGMTIDAIREFVQVSQSEYDSLKYYFAD